MYNDHVQKETETRNAIMLLDDRSDMRLSTKSYLDSLNVESFMADNIAKAYAILNKYHKRIQTAIIDKNLQDENGVQFIIEAIEEYPKIKYVLLTAWEVSEEEVKILKKLNVPIKDKHKFTPSEFLQYHGIQNTRIQSQKKINYNIVDEFSKEEAKEEILKLRLEKQYIVLKYDDMKESWTKISNNLKKQIDSYYKNNEDNEKFVLGDKEYSPAELLEEIKNCTSTGKYLVEIHMNIVDDVLNINLNSKKRYGWLSKIFFLKK